MAITPEALVDRVQVNVPFPFLIDGYLDRFLNRGLNPEIGLDAWSLGTYPPKTLRGIARVFRDAGRRLTIHGPFQDLAPGADVAVPQKKPSGNARLVMNVPSRRDRPLQRRGGSG